MHHDLEASMLLHEFQYPGSIGPNCFAEDMDDIPRNIVKIIWWFINMMLYAKYTYNLQNWRLNFCIADDLPNAL